MAEVKLSDINFTAPDMTTSLPLDYETVELEGFRLHANANPQGATILRRATLGHLNSFRCKIWPLEKRLM
jgi:hypothetical protein